MDTVVGPSRDPSVGSRRRPRKPTGVVCSDVNLEVRSNKETPEVQNESRTGEEVRSGSKI